MTTEKRVLTKAQVLKSLETLPDDATIEDIIDHLYFIYKVERGLQASEVGDLLTQEEVEERVRQWFR